MEEFAGEGGEWGSKPLCELIGCTLCVVDSFRLHDVFQICSRDVRQEIPATCFRVWYESFLLMLANMHGKT